MKFPKLESSKHCPKSVLFSSLSYINGPQFDLTQYVMVKMASLPSLATPKSTLSFSAVLLFLHFPFSAGDGSPDTGSGPDLHAKGLILVKVWCLIIMLVTTFAGGVSPYFFRWNEAFLLLGTQFAGGVFLGTSLMHFLSDSTSTFGQLSDKDYPFSFMLASAGYLLTMLGDCVIMHVTRKIGNRDSTGKVGAAEEGGLDESDRRGTEDVNPMFLQTTSLGDTILLILALCIHSVFEGIAVGVSGNQDYIFRMICLFSMMRSMLRRGTKP